MESISTSMSRILQHLTAHVAVNRYHVDFVMEPVRGEPSSLSGYFSVRYYAI